MYRILKRLADVVLSGAALLLLSPLLIPVMIVLRMTGEGEVFFLQERIGRENRPFRIIKFATMLKDSPASGTVTARGDPRILPVGRVLRSTKINELPQLINVLLGQMSVVGPRPLTQEAFDLYPDQVKPLVYRSKPGITGIGCVVFRHEEDILAASDKPVFQCYREDIMPIKGALEVWYLRRRSLWTDLKIVILTVVAILRPGNTLHARWFKDLPDTSLRPKESGGGHGE